MFTVLSANFIVSVGARPVLSQCKVNEELDPLIPFRCSNIDESSGVKWRVGGTLMTWCSSSNECTDDPTYKFQATRSGSVSELSLRPPFDIRDEEDKQVECDDDSAQSANCEIKVFCKFFVRLGFLLENSLKIDFKNTTAV